MFSARGWVRAWIAGLVLVLLPTACKQDPTALDLGSSNKKDPPGHPGLGLESVPLANSPFAVAIHRRGIFYVSTVFGPIVRGELPSTSLSNQTPVGILESQVRISPDGRIAYVNDQDRGTIEVIDVGTNVIRDTIYAIPSILTTGISNDGRTLYSLTDYHGIDVISTRTLQITGNIPASRVGSLLTGVAFHPTKPLMYVAARDAGVVTVVQIPANTVVKSLAVPGGRIQNVAVSHDGTQLFATDIQRSKLIVWDLLNENASYQEIAIGSGQVRNAFDVAETPDGVQLYISALADGNVYILDRATFVLLATLAVGGSPRYIAFNASGTHAIIPNEAGFVTFVHEGGTPPPPPPGPSACPTPRTGTAPSGRTHPSLTTNISSPFGGAPVAVAISRDSVAYITANNGTGVRADLPSPTLSVPFPVGALPSQVRISPDGRTAYVENQDSRTITYLDVATNRIIGTASVPVGSILNMGLSADGTRIYALTDYYGVYVIDVQSRSVVAQIPASSTGSLLTGVAFHPFASCMYVTARDEGVVRTIDLTQNTVVGSRAVTGGRVQTVAVSLDGATLYATDIQRSKLISWDLHSGNSSYTETNVGTQVVRNAFDVAVTPDNAQLWVSTLADGKVFVFDRINRAGLGEIVTGGSARYIGFTPGGTQSVIANESGWVNFVGGAPPPPPPPSACTTPRTGSAPTGLTHPSLRVNEVSALSAQPFAVAISRNNVAYITQGWNASAVRADLPSIALSAPFPVGDLPSQVRMSPDGSTAYVENQDARTITYIDVATNHIIGQATVPEGSILNMGLSRDGSRIYALTDYYGVFVVDVHSRAVIAQIPASSTGMLLTGVAFHPFAACMYVSARDQAIVSTVDLTTNAVVGQRFVNGGRIQTVAVSLDGVTLYGADIGRSKIVSWSLPSNASAFSETNVGTQMNRNAFDVEVTPDNAQLWVSTLYDGKVYVFDRVTRASLGQINTGGNARYIAFTPSGSRAVIANEMGWVNFVR